MLALRYPRWLVSVLHDSGQIADYDGDAYAKIAIIVNVDSRYCL